VPWVYVSKRYPRASIMGDDVSERGIHVLVRQQ
jgi:hypothetical protein